jgi:esterase
MILHAAEAGEGPPIALLHGLFGQARNLGVVARHLAPRYRVISLDLRNHGESPCAAGMAYPDLAMDVLETLQALGALPALLLGHSMGGKAAMAAALKSPAQVSGLIVGDIAPVAYAHANGRIAAALRAIELAPGLTRGAADRDLAGRIADPALRGFLLQNLVPGAHPAWRLGLDQIAAAMPDIEGFPDLPAEARYAGPALFIRGAESDYVPPALYPAIRARFPAARIVVLDRAGHWLHADQPSGFLAAIDDFLADP